MKKIIKLTSLVLLGIVLVGLQACGNKKVDRTHLENKSWILRTFNGENVKSVFEGKIPTIEFNFNDSMVSGNSGCNRYFGKFSLTKDNKFVVPHAAGTLMACPWMNKESDYLKILAADNLYLSVEKDTVLILKQDKKEVMRFTVATEEDKNSEIAAKSVVPPVVALDKQEGVSGQTRKKDDAGNKKATVDILQGDWVLKGIANENIDEMFGQRKPTIVFDKEGKVHGNAGCNNYRSSYKLEEHILTFSPIASTRMACPEFDGETHFIQFLGEPVEAYLNMDDTALLFFKDDNLVLEFVKE